MSEPQATKKRSVVPGCLIVIAFVCILIIWGVMSPQPEKPDDVQVGDAGYLQVENTPTGAITLARTHEAEKQATECVLAHDQTGYTQLLLAGDIFLVPTGTQVLVLGQAGFGVRKIRVLTGDYAGQVGYLPFEWVRKKLR